MIVTSKTPILDLHNEIESMVEVLVNRFIKDNYLMKKDVVIIIHGKSGHIVRDEAHRVLKNNKLVKSYRLDNWNLGQTIVEIDVDKTGNF